MNLLNITFVTVVGFIILPSSAVSSKLHCKFIHTFNNEENIWESIYVARNEHLKKEYRRKERIMGPFRVTKDFWEEENSWTVVVKKIPSNPEIGERIIATVTLNTNKKKKYSPLLLEVDKNRLDIECQVMVPRKSN